jgi:hypothetical protein
MFQRRLGIAGLQREVAELAFVANELALYVLIRRIGFQQLRAQGERLLIARHRARSIADRDLAIATLNVADLLVRTRQLPL